MATTGTAGVGVKTGDRVAGASCTRAGAGAGASRAGAGASRTGAVSFHPTTRPVFARGWRCFATAAGLVPAGAAPADHGEPVRDAITLCIAIEAQQDGPVDASRAVARCLCWTGTAGASVAGCACAARGEFVATAAIAAASFADGVPPAAAAFARVAVGGRPAPRPIPRRGLHTPAQTLFERVGKLAQLLAT